MASLALMHPFIYLLALQPLAIAVVAKRKIVANQFHIGAIIPTLTTAKTRWKFARERVMILAT